MHLPVTRAVEAPLADRTALAPAEVARVERWRGSPTVLQRVDDGEKRNGRPEAAVGNHP